MGKRNTHPVKVHRVGDNPVLARDPHVPDDDPDHGEGLHAVEEGEVAAAGPGGAEQLGPVGAQAEAAEEREGGLQRPGGHRKNLGSVFPCSSSLSLTMNN